MSGTGPWSWHCAGSNGGATASCSAKLLANGACGIDNGTNPLKAPWSVYGTPASSLCASGKVSAESGSGPWTWMCVGSNGGVTANCSATPPVNGACGTANNTPSAGAPASNLCNVGTASTVSGSGPWNWSCAGSNSGSTASCSALQQLPQGAVLPAGSYTSNAAVIEIPQLCSSHTESFPKQWTWDASKIVNQPRAATAADNLTPRIDQVRNGQVIASYTSFGSNTKTCSYTWPTASIHQ